MSVEESDDYVKSAKKNKMDTIFLISPNTKTERIKKISKVTSGFLYLVSIYGTTGTKSGIKQYTIDAIRKTKNTIKGKVPIGVGFGIYTPNDVKRFISIGVDAVIVGSAFMKIIEKTSSNQIENKVMQFTLQMKKATKKH
jgi:tryptophan synthase alpha chain